MSRIVRLRTPGTPRWAVERDGQLFGLEVALGSLLAMPLTEARAVVDGATTPLPPAGGKFAAPVDEQEVWACGVTYQRSRQGREEESVSASLYTAVYEARRPEVFFKSVPSRVVGDGEDVGIRADSGWDVPEPELGLVVNSGGDIVGYVVGNDMSSRSIEGENPLYLPQAKVYERSCALGPGIVPAWEVEGPFDISVQITRGQADVFSAKTSTATMHRDLTDLVDWTTRAMEFPQGLVLLTGTGLVPERDVTLQAGDVITIGIDCVGTLTNSVRMVGR